MEMGLNWIDFALFGVVLICFLFGLVSGLLMQVAGLLSVIGGMLAGIFGGPYVSGWLSPWITTELIANGLGYLLCFLAATLIIRLLAYFLHNIFEKYKLKRFDRFAGGIIGAVKGLLLCAVLIVIAGYAGTESLRQTIDTSPSGARCMAAAEWVLQRPALQEVVARFKEIAKTSAEGYQDQNQTPAN